MRPVDQTILHGGDRLGDCWRACIASLVDADIEAVPHFVELDERVKVGRYDRMTDTWLRRTRDLRLVRPYVASSDGVPFIFDRIDDAQIGPKIFPEYLIVGGTSPRNVGHAVIARAADYLALDRNKPKSAEICSRWLAHDPHPSRAGLVSWYEIFAILPIRHLFAQEQAA